MDPVQELLRPFCCNFYFSIVLKFYVLDSL